MASPGPTNGVAPTSRRKASPGSEPSADRRGSPSFQRDREGIDRLPLTRRSESLDLKSKIQDGAVGLGDPSFTLVQAATMLGTVPDEPFKQWLETHFQQATQAATAVLAASPPASRAGRGHHASSPRPSRDNDAELDGAVSERAGGRQANA